MYNETIDYYNMNTEEFIGRTIHADMSICQAASEYIGQSVECMRFDELKAKEEYDGIWACASLLHVEKSELPAVLTRFHCTLKPTGVLYASFNQDKPWINIVVQKS